MATRINFNALKSLFNSNNCILLSEYINCETKLDYICSCGNINSKLIKHYKKNHRCKNCNMLKRYGYKLSAGYKSAKKSYINLVPRSVASQYSRLDKNFEALGYTDEEYYNHLKKFPVFYQSDWHVDHIFPIKAYTDHGLDTLKLPHVVNALDNLRPMPKQENQEKGADYDPELFIKFLRKHNCRPLLNPYNINLENYDDDDWIFSL